MEPTFIHLFSATDAQVLVFPQALEPFTQGFEDEVSDQGGNNGNQKICASKNVDQGESQSLSSSIGSVEFTHQEIRIEEEDDERNLYGRPQDRGEFPWAFWILRHGAMVNDT